jgi:hypothetical protein
LASYKTAKVKTITHSDPGLVKMVVEIDGKDAPAIAYPGLTGPINTGDEVIINTTAVELALGSGGFHVVVWNQKYRELETAGAGHIMKLRYTPMQFNVMAAEENASGVNELIKGDIDLMGMPVVVGSLHSQLGPAAAVIKMATGGTARIAYIMTDRAALPLALSEQVRDLKQKGLIDTTITAGQAFGGDIEAVNIYSALAVAKNVAAADAVIITMGVGIVGTETFLGFSGIEQGELVNAVFALKGRAIAVPRIMFADARPRHQGLSKQTEAALGVAALAACDVPVPRMDPDKHAQVMAQLEDSGLAAKHRIMIINDDGTEEALAEYGISPRTMGRGFFDEPEFFRAAGAAGYIAASMLKDKP